MSIWKKITNQNSWLHKLLSYGVASLVIALAVITSPGSEGLNPSSGTLIIIFILYYTLLTKRILETLIFATVFGSALLDGHEFITNFKEQLYTTLGNVDFA